MHPNWFDSMKNKRILVVIPFIDSVPLKGFEVLLKNHIDELVRYYSVDIICLNQTCQHCFHRTSPA